jgi:hypothetical protein
MVPLEFSLNNMRFKIIMRRDSNVQLISKCRAPFHKLTDITQIRVAVLGTSAGIFVKTVSSGDV